ncbi:hypothetical protein [Gemmata sp.]|uniref:hypothetical protein n=1 Tax=Gemmata sp. TaxID=1914242 RepID=UPI003F725DA0
MALVAAVEEALTCCLPDEALACVANYDDSLGDDDFVLGSIVDNTHLAWKRGCPKDLVAVGRQGDSLAFYCVSRSGPRDRGVQLVDRDNLDGSLNYFDLGEWLARIVEGRQEFLSEDHPSLIEWAPSQTELAAFIPSLVG